MSFTMGEPWETLCALLVFFCFFLVSLSLITPIFIICYQALIITIVLEKRQPIVYLDDNDIEDPVLPCWYVADPYQHQLTDEEIAQLW